MKSILLIVASSLLLAACSSTDSTAQIQCVRLEKIRQDCTQYYSGQDMATEGKIANCINARKASIRL